MSKRVKSARVKKRGKKKHIQSNKKYDACFAIKDSSGTKLEILRCVSCKKDNSIVLVTDCDGCSYRDGETCLYDGKNRIEVIGLGTPHKFNRNTSESVSLQERDIALAYYLPTKILQPVKLISREEYPNYRKIKERLVKGDFKDKEPPLETVPVSIKPTVTLIETDKDGDCDLLMDGRKFTITDDKVNEGSMFNIIYYLYDMFTLDGLSDIRINDRYYKISFSKVSGVKEDMVMGAMGKHLVIGEVR